MRLLRIDFVKGKNRLTCIYRKTFQLYFNRNSEGFTYGGCFCQQDYPKCFIKSNNKIVKSYKAIKSPTIIVAKQSNFLKTLGILIHELGHYIIWLLFYWKKRTKLYDLFTDWYDGIFAKKPW